MKQIEPTIDEDWRGGRLAPSGLPAYVTVLHPAVVSGPLPTAWTASISDGPERFIPWRAIFELLGVPSSSGTFSDAMEERPGVELPAGLIWPMQGTLSEGLWRRILSRLDPDADVIALWEGPPLLSETDVAYAGRVREFVDLDDVASDEVFGTPHRLWARDRSFLLATDPAFELTVVAGPTSLIEALARDDGIETRAFEPTD